MVGRDAELAQLLATLQRTVAKRRASAVTVVGEAGLGKSRLLAEFEQPARIPAGCWLLLGRAHPRSAVAPFGLLRDMLLRQLQIGENDSADVARASCRSSWRRCSAPKATRRCTCSAT